MVHLFVSDATQRDKEIRGKSNIEVISGTQRFAASQQLSVVPLYRTFLQKILKQ